MNQPPYGQPPGGGAPPYGQPPGGGPPGGMPPQGGGGGFNPPQYGYGHQPGAPPQHYHAPAAPGPTMPDKDAAKGFFGALLDFSFSSFVTTRLIKVLYVLWLIGLALGALGGLAGAAMNVVNGQIINGVISLVVLPFALVAGLILGRMWHELIIVQFRIAENLEEINKKTRG